MDCTAAQSLLLDEIYGDLVDDDDSVELATHVAGCPACGEEFVRLKAYRADFAVPAIEVPVGLGARIMAAVDAAAAKTSAANALPVAPSVRASSRPPWARTLSAVVSHAGAWAMRPQTAMAAVFLLMVGSSAWLLREHSRGETSALEAEGKERGAPLAPPAAATPASEFDPEAARAAHGLSGAGGGGPKPPSPALPAQGQGFGEGESKAKRGLEAPADLGGPARVAAETATAAADRDDAYGGDGKRSEGRAKSASAEELSKNEAGDTSSAMAHYRAGRFDDATAGFDTLARQGDANAELWAARSVREGHGCRTALTRFDHLGGTTLGTPAGNDATMDGALCYRALGQIEASTQRLQRLLAYDGYSAKARAEIENNHRILVARKEAQAGASAGGAASPRAAPKAATKPAGSMERARTERSLE